MQPDRISPRCCFLINLPVVLFLLAAAGLLGLFFTLGRHWLPVALAWACCCGAGMLTYDYRTRKRREFLALCRIGGSRGTTALPIQSLKSTICGRCMLQAFHLHTKRQ
jgi:hypothetical protein